MSQPLCTAAAGDHAQGDLGQAEDGVVGRHPQVAGQGQLEPHAEREAVELGHHRLRAPLGGGDVPGQVGELLGAAGHEPGNVAAGGERLLTGAPEDDHPHAAIVAERGEDGGQMVAGRHADPVHLLGDVEGDRGDAALGVALEVEAVVGLGHGRGSSRTATSAIAATIGS